MNTSDPIQIAATPIKVRFTVGPVTIDTEAIPEQIVLLLKRTVEEFMTAKIIPEAKLDTSAGVASTT